MTVTAEIKPFPTDQRGGSSNADAAAHVEESHRVQLTWIGNGAWRACDVTIPADDARCLIAYVECVDHHVEVLWIGARRPPSFFGSLREAYIALNRSLD